MLIDVEPILGCLGHLYKPEDLWHRLEQGVFLTHLNGYAEHFPHLNHRPKFGDEPDSAARWYNNRHDRDSYGVCDNVEQIKLHYPELVESGRRFVVTMTEIRHEDQAEQGWRWHKWGRYIGDHTPQYEYLADEIGIERVFVFNILEVAEHFDT